MTTLTDEKLREMYEAAYYGKEGVGWPSMRTFARAVRDAAFREAAGVAKLSNPIEREISQLPCHNNGVISFSEQTLRDNLSTNLIKKIPDKAAEMVSQRILALISTQEK